jgi:hypothetical protein
MQTSWPMRFNQFHVVQITLAKTPDKETRHEQGQGERMGLGNKIPHCVAHRHDKQGLQQKSLEKSITIYLFFIHLVYQ